MNAPVDKAPLDVALGEREAQRLVGEQAIRDAFEAVADGFLEAWKVTKPQEAARREELYMRFIAVQDVWQALRRKAGNARKRDIEAAANG